MKKRSIGFILTDIILIIMIILPFLAGILLKVLFVPQEEGISITGAYVYFTVPLPLFDLPISEAQINSWMVILSVFFLCLYLTHGLKEHPDTKRQLIAEWIVEQTDKLVKENMGDYFAGFSPFIASILAISAFSSLSSLLGLFPPTSDINIVAGWAILVFILITYYKLKCGLWNYIKGFGEPFLPFAPFNVVSEFATPVSMTFRHYGNVLSGSVISVLVAAGLQGLSNMIFGNLPGFLGQFPFFRIGIPAVLSVYFDVFSGCLQAFIFAMLTMLYVSGAFSIDDYEKRKIMKQQKKMKKLNTNN